MREYPGVETLEGYLATLASDAPTPGGGSAATLVAAFGAALVAMVARITAKNASYTSHHAQARALISECDDLRGRFLAARDDDERAYGAVVSAQALPRATETERTTRMLRLQSALAEAAAAPLATAHLACELLGAAGRARALRNSELMSDVLCAAHFGAAALAASAANVRVNHRYLKDSALVARQVQQLARDERVGAELFAIASGA